MLIKHVLFSLLPFPHLYIMEAITNWFNGKQDYLVGVAIYASLPCKKTRTLRLLNKGKNNRNMATLVSELRKFKNAPAKPAPSNKKKIVLVKTTAVTQTDINNEASRKQITNQSVKREFSGIKMGDLPPELRTKFLQAQKLFYDMIELKFALNDLPAAAQSDALKIQLQIEALDEQRDVIWEALHHWKKHKTLLVEPIEDFKGLTDLQLDGKRRNLRSSVSKITKRVNAWYEDLDAEKDPHKQRLIENKINRSEKLLYAHNMNIKKINRLI